MTQSANNLSRCSTRLARARKPSAATDGLTSLTSLLQQALSTVQQAQSSNWTTAATTTSSVSLSSTANVSLAAGTLDHRCRFVDLQRHDRRQRHPGQHVEADIDGTTGLGSTGSVRRRTTARATWSWPPTTRRSASLLRVAPLRRRSVFRPIPPPTTSRSVQSSTRSTLQSNFNTLLTQVSQLASDAGYNGVNLLQGDSLTIDFNPTGTSALTISGVTFNASGLGLSAASGSGATSFQSDSDALDLSATSTRRSRPCRPRPKRSAPTRRPSAPGRGSKTRLINTLQTGAANLVVADQNVESANLLTEQTQQQLEISALSIANQANQSVLKLFG